MSTFTKEQLIEQAKKNIEVLRGAAERIPGASDAAVIHLKLAEITLASLEAEAVCVIDQPNLDYLKSGSDADVWPASRTEMGDVLLYRVSPPAPVTVPDEVTTEDCPAFVKYDVTDVDEAWSRGFNACRAAMLQGTDDNSPVIPDGWVACSERMPEEGSKVIVFRPRASESNDPPVKTATYKGGREYYHGFDCYCEPTHWMPLPAAPQQEVK